MCKIDYSWSPCTCIFNNRKYRKCIADTSVISCDENISVMDIVSTKMTNTIATYASINFHTKKVKDCYILRTVLFTMMLLLIITIICCHCALTHDISFKTLIGLKPFRIRVDKIN